MMDNNKIIEALRQSQGIGLVEEIKYKPGFLVLRLVYDYDEDELEAAKDYANSQTSLEKDEDNWYDEYYIPYIIDLAVDEVRDTIEEIVEEMDIDAQYISYEPERDDESCEFIAVFTNKDTEYDIDDVLDEAGL